MKRRLTTALVLASLKMGISVTAFIGVYGILSKLAYIERGYEAVGGEVMVAAIVGAGAYILADNALRYVFQTTKKASDRNHSGNRAYDGHSRSRS